MMPYSIELVLLDLKEKFKGLTFEFEIVKFGGEVAVFFIHADSEEDLCMNWTKVVEFIAGNFQVNTEQEFTVWNIYLFFLLENRISKSLQYQIENDTFSSRKIIICGQADKKAITDEHIRNVNLHIEQPGSKIQVADFRPLPKLDKILKNVSAKRRINNEIRESLDLLIKAVKK
jgi:hypothetical protein